LVVRNKPWFQTVVPLFRGVWDTILKERVSGYEHRKPKKREKKINVIKTGETKETGETGETKETKKTKETGEIKETKKKYKRKITEKIIKVDI